MEINSDISDSFCEQQKNIVKIIDEVIKRDYNNDINGYDDYSLLIQQKEYREVIIFSIYENYFEPKRHEFELQLVKEIVDGVCNSSVVQYIGFTAKEAIIGGVAFAAFSSLCKTAANCFKMHDKKRSIYFEEIIFNANKIREYYKTNKKATINEIESDLQIERDKVVPILKILGFKCHKQRKKTIWIRPD